MNKVRFILCLCLLLAGMAVSAQTYERVVRNNLWNDSHNITGVRQDTVSHSYAELYGRYDGGEFRDTWQASMSWSAGAATSSIRHLEKMTLKGSFSFTQTEGYDMCGSMFIKPGFYPVDILEFTPGRKTLQTYAFDGGLSYDIASNWRLGAKMDFESSNMAKRKDLRHSNWRLDMTVAPGLMYHKGDFAVGANYIFRKTSETVEAEQVGISESSYYAFLDKGLMYGVYSIWTGSGLHLEEAGVKGFPVKDMTNGAAVQLQYKGFFAELDYMRTSGSVGEKEYVWFNFPSESADICLGYRHLGKESRHYARLAMSWKRLSLEENILEKVSENGVTTVIDHGSNHIFAENVCEVMPEYEFVSDKVEVLARAEWKKSHEISSQMYPYVYTQALTAFGAEMRVKLYAGAFDYSMTLGYAGGEMSEESWLTDETTGVQTSPYRLQDWYDRTLEYKTADRVKGAIAVRWNFWKGLYTECSGHWIHGFNLRHLASPDRFGAELKIGYNF